MTGEPGVVPESGATGDLLVVLGRILIAQLETNRLLAVIANRLPPDPDSLGARLAAAPDPEPVPYPWPGPGWAAKVAERLAAEARTETPAPDPDRGMGAGWVQNCGERFALPADGPEPTVVCCRNRGHTGPHSLDPDW